MRENLNSILFICLFLYLSSIPLQGKLPLTNPATFFCHRPEGGEVMPRQYVCQAANSTDVQGTPVNVLGFEKSSN